MADGDALIMRIVPKDSLKGNVVSVRFGMLLQTISFVGLIAFDGILGKDKVEVVYKEIEHVNGSTVGVSKLFGSFSVNGGGYLRGKCDIGLSAVIPQNLGYDTSKQWRIPSEYKTRRNILSPFAT